MWPSPPLLLASTVPDVFNVIEIRRLRRPLNSLNIMILFPCYSKYWFMDGVLSSMSNRLPLTFLRNEIRCSSRTEQYFSEFIVPGQSTKGPSWFLTKHPHIITVILPPLNVGWIQSGKWRSPRLLQNLSSWASHLYKTFITPNDVFPVLHTPVLLLLTPLKQFFPFGFTDKWFWWSDLTQTLSKHGSQSLRKLLFDGLL